MRVSLIAAIVIFLTAPLGAQWLTYRTVGLPRLADGKPNLAAPAPRTPEGKPDLSGLWQRIESKYAENIAADLKTREVQPWAQDLVKDRVESLSKQHMSVQCLPWGPNYTNSARMTKIVQTPNLIVMLDEGLTYRQIFTDGRRSRPIRIPVGWVIRSGIGMETRWSSTASDTMSGAGSITEAILTRRRCASPNATAVPTSATCKLR